MSALIQSIGLGLTIGFVYIWIQQPLLEQYALQAFAVSVLLYFILKRASRSKLWHVAPTPLSWEMLIATFAFSLLIGATGNVGSPFFALTFVHLFFLSLAMPAATSLVVSGMLVLFHYGLAPEQIMTAWPILVSLPIVTIFFLFGKQQHEEVIRERRIITQDEQLLASARAEEQSLLDFVAVFLTSKIAQIKQLSQYAQLNKEAIEGQLTLLEIEIQNVLAPFKQQPERKK